MYLNDNKITRRRGGSFAPKLLFYRTGKGVLVRVYCCIYIYKKKDIHCKLRHIFKLLRSFSL